MNDEDAFQAALDADPADHFLREVFADWLGDRDDERAEGYRALGRLRLRSIYHADCQAGLRPTNPFGCWELWSERAVDDGDIGQSQFPDDWLFRVEGGFRYMTDDKRLPMSVDFLTRREAEDAAARAFAALPAARRAELLAGKAVPA